MAVLLCDSMFWYSYFACSTIGRKDIPYMLGDKHQLMFQGVTAKSVGLPILSTVLFFWICIESV